MSTQLPVIPGGWSENEIEVGSRSFLLWLPADPDSFLDDPDVLEANRQSDFMPYWSYLWPSSLKMARLLCESSLFAREKSLAALRTLEIGSGIGLVGVAALAVGFEVMFSDYDETALLLARHNAERNGFAGHSVRLDWQQIDKTTLDPFPVILGCDVIYEVTNHPLVLNVLDRLLESGGVCWLGDPGRGPLSAFVCLAEEREFEVTAYDEAGKQVPPVAGRSGSGGSGDRRFIVNEFRLLRLRRSSR